MMVTVTVTAAVIEVIMIIVTLLTDLLVQTVLCLHCDCQVTAQYVLLVRAADSTYSAVRTGQYMPQTASRSKQ